jgi:hypothetical protein
MRSDAIAVIIKPRPPAHRLAMSITEQLRAREGHGTDACASPHTPKRSAVRVIDDAPSTNDVPKLADCVAVDTAAIRVEPLRLDSPEALDAVVQLGDQNRDRLGQLPYAVFTEAAEQSRLLVALSEADGPPIGYALYRLPRNEVSLTHLCISEAARHCGVARMLVDAISSRHPSRLGIRAKCRDDYELANVWENLGFQSRASTVGRGQDRAPMTVWWKDHGHADLFTEYEQAFELRPAIDLNIVRDLAKPEARNHRSDFLIADHLADRLQLVVTSGMRAEINRATTERRGPLLEAIDGYPVMNANPGEATQVQERILEAVQAKSPQFPVTPQDQSDLMQVAHAAAAGMGVFLTWDEGLRKRLGPAVAELTGMKIMAPDYVVLHLDELANSESFLKQSLAGSALSRTRAGSDVEKVLDAFVANSAGERRRDLHSRVGQLIRDGHPIELIYSEDGTPIAIYSTITDERSLRVPLLRLADHKTADMIARHLLWSFRRQAKNTGSAVVDISEPHPSSRIGQAADFESMIHVNEHWYAPVVDVCGTAYEVAAAANRSFEFAGLEAPPLLSPRLSQHAAARLEQAWWPAKIIDSEVPCYAVPIRAPFAFELFGYPDGLLPRDTQLSLGREHVYYHSSRGSVLSAPARILWLATGQGSGTGHFFGVSLLDGLIKDSPERLHSALSYYGVFDLPAITKAANGAPIAEALRLSNTEVFDRPVSRRRYEIHRQRLTTGSKDFPKDFYNARRLNPNLFGAIYNEGTRSTS